MEAGCHIQQLNGELKRANGTIHIKCRLFVRYLLEKGQKIFRNHRIFTDWQNPTTYLNGAIHRFQVWNLCSCSYKYNFSLIVNYVYTHTVFTFCMSYRWKNSTYTLLQTTTYMEGTLNLRELYLSYFKQYGTMTVLFFQGKGNN